MQIQMFAVVLAFAMGINAAAWKPTVQSYADKCGNTGALSCCNPSSSQVAASSLLGLIPGSGIAGGTCQQIPADVAGVGVGSPEGICGGNTVSCCKKTTTNQLGVLNLQTTCSPLAL